MPSPTYSDGTISIDNGSASLSGDGTAWSTQVKPGDTIYAVPPAATMFVVGVVEAVVGNGAITLADIYRGTALNDHGYRIVRGYAWWSGAAANEILIRFVTELGPLGLAGASSGPPAANEGRDNQINRDRLTGLLTQRYAGVWEAIAANLAFDEVGLAANLSDHDAAAEGFVYLATDTSVYYFKLSATSGDWSDPVSLKGADGVGDIFAFQVTAAYRPLAGEVLPGALLADPITFPAGSAAFFGRSEEPAASEAVWSIRHTDDEGAETIIGTVTFATGSKIGVGSSSLLVGEVGDQIDFIAPDPRDATQTGIKIIGRGSH